MDGAVDLDVKKNRNPRRCSVACPRRRVGPPAAADLLALLSRPALQVSAADGPCGCQCHQEAFRLDQALLNRGAQQAAGPAIADGPRRTVNDGTIDAGTRNTAARVQIFGRSIGSRRVDDHPARRHDSRSVGHDHVQSLIALPDQPVGLGGADATQRRCRCLTKHSGPALLFVGQWAAVQDDDTVALRTPPPSPDLVAYVAAVDARCRQLPSGGDGVLRYRQGSHPSVVGESCRRLHLARVPQLGRDALSLSTAGIGDRRSGRSRARSAVMQRGSGGWASKVPWRGGRRSR
jgi:hypothetical protein